jgi:hypothetical protein
MTFDDDELALFSDSDSDDAGVNANANAINDIHAAAGDVNSDNDSDGMQDVYHSEYAGRRRSDRGQTTRVQRHESDVDRLRRIGGMFDGDDGDDAGIEALLNGDDVDRVAAAASSSSLAAATGNAGGSLVHAADADGDADPNGKKKARKVTKISNHEKLDAAK